MGPRSSATDRELISLEEMGQDVECVFFTVLPAGSAFEKPQPAPCTQPDNWNNKQKS